MLPFMVDQGLNARVLHEKKVGIQIPRGEEDGHLNFQGLKAKQKWRFVRSIFTKKKNHPVWYCYDRLIPN
ncbi:hypothetical protein ACSBR1_025026 [Camellia fascicularis]